jgi:hypothetical protein
VIRLSDQPKDSTPRKGTDTAPASEEVLSPLEPVRPPESWRSPFPQKTFIFNFSDVRNVSEEQIVSIWTEQCLARIKESSAVYAAYDGPPSRYKPLRVEHSLSSLRTWTETRLSELPHLKADRIFVLVAPSEEWLPDRERDAALPLIEKIAPAMPWIKKALTETGLLDKRILREATGIKDAEVRESVVSQSPPDAEAFRHLPKRGGRPRKDAERKKILALKNEKKSWSQIATIMTKETGKQMSADACRKLVK